MGLSYLDPNSRKTLLSSVRGVRPLGYVLGSRDQFVHYFATSHVALQVMWA